MADTSSRQQRRAAERDKAKRLKGGAPEKTPRSPLMWAAIGSVVLLVVIAALVIVKVTQSSSSSTPATGGSGNSAAPAAVVKSVTSIPASTFNAVGYQSGVGMPKAAGTTPLKNAAGKPLMLYIGGEFCPYCAAERWPTVIALSRFGTFSNLGATHSSSSDVYPSTATFSFHGATYSSPYLALDASEIYSNIPSGNGYKPLDKPSPAQVAASQKYNPSGSIPFLSFGNLYAISGASYNPGVLKGMTMAQIATAIEDPTTDVSKNVLGTANGMTAALCKQTGGKPANVCSSPAVTAAAAHLG